MKTSPADQENCYHTLSGADHRRERESIWLKKLLIVLFALCVVAGTSMLLVSGNKGFPACATDNGLEVSRRCDFKACNSWRKRLPFLQSRPCAAPTVLCDKGGQLFELSGACIKDCHTD